MALTTDTSPRERVSSGIPGFDDLSLGGLPRSSTTLLSGTSGGGKTSFALAFLVNQPEPGVLVTTERRPLDLIRDAASFGWDLERLVAADRVRIVDATPDVGEQVLQTGAFELTGLLARILHAATSINARRLVIDSLDGVVAQFEHGAVMRNALLGLCLGLVDYDLTSILCAARIEDFGPISTHGVEEFVVDNVIVLHNKLSEERRRRTVEIVKLRGAAHRQGARPMVIGPAGVEIVPVAAPELDARAAVERISLGVPGIDEMCGGGVFRDSVVLVSGSTGSGKSLLAGAFAAAALAAGERSMIYSFEESAERLARNARSYGLELAPGAESLRVVARMPERMSAEDMLVTMRREVEEFAPDRVALDNVTTLARASDPRVFREFIIALVNLLRRRGTSVLFTGYPPAVAAQLLEESHFSVIADAVILLRYYQREGEIRRCLTVLKLRGSRHDRNVREYTIGEAGLQVGHIVSGAAVFGPHVNGSSTEESEP
jgi:circadian clock protein KaiC